MKLPGAASGLNDVEGEQISRVISVGGEDVVDTHFAIHSSKMGVYDGISVHSVDLSSFLWYFKRDIARMEKTNVQTNEGIEFTFERSPIFRSDFEGTSSSH